MHTWPAVMVCAGESRNAAGIGKIEKKCGGDRKSTPQRWLSGGQDRRYPAVLDLGDGGERQKIFRAREARAKNFFWAGGKKKAVGINKKKQKGGGHKQKQA